MKKAFVVLRSITMVDGKPHVETYSEQELVCCNDCRYASRHCSDSVFGEALYDCRHTRNIGAERLPVHSGGWFCADGVMKDD